MRRSYVSVMTNAAGTTLCTGVTNALERRVYEHKNGLTPGFASKYNVTRLVYYEMTADVDAAISREKQIKGWTRARKIRLVQSENRRGWT